MPNPSTIRVANPAEPGSYMTINVADLAEAHVLWPEQAEGFVPLPPKAAITDPAVRDLAARIMIGLTAERLKLSGEDWDALSDAERLRQLQDAEVDCGDLLAIRHVARKAEAVASPLAVIKGPRGLWYVTRGDERVSKGYPTQPEASVELTRMTAA